MMDIPKQTNKKAHISLKTNFGNFLAFQMAVLADFSDKKISSRSLINWHLTPEKSKRVKINLHNRGPFITIILHTIILHT